MINPLLVSILTTALMVELGEGGTKEGGYGQWQQQRTNQRWKEEKRNGTVRSILILRQQQKPTVLVMMKAFLPRPVNVIIEGRLQPVLDFVFHFSKMFDRGKISELPIMSRRCNYKSLKFLPFSFLQFRHSDESLLAIKIVK